MYLTTSSIYFSLTSSSPNLTNVPGVMSSLKLQDLLILMDFLLTSRMIVLAREGRREKGVLEPGVTQYPAVAVANII